MKRRTKILFALPNLQGGGAERVFVTILQYLNRDEFDPILVVGRLRGPFVADLPPDLEIIELKAERARNATFKLLKTAWAAKPDIIFSTLGFGVSAALIRPLLPPETKVAYRLSNTWSAYLADVATENITLSKLYYLLKLLILKNSDILIAQSDYMREDALNLFNRRREDMIRIYNPIDLSQVLPRSEEICELFNERFDKELITVGRLSYQKDHHLLIEAMAELTNLYPNTRLTILGKGDERRVLEEQIETLGLSHHIRLVGFVDNPYPLVAAADLFVLPSRYEGFANVLLESLALGTPAVAMNCPGGNAEIITDDINGWLCNERTPKALANCIAKGLKRLPTIDEEAIKEDIARRFDAPSIAAKYGDAFNRL